MRVEALDVDRLIDSIADGAPIEWQALEAAAVGERDRRVLRNLRVISGVAELHRTIAADDPAGPATPAAAERLSRWGHLLIVEKIGEGSFGEVYRARDTWLERDVALKLLKPTDDRERPLRIVHEARTLARVRHPNVVAIHGADFQDGRVGLWMELVEGRALERVLAAQGPFGAAEASVVGRELCGALAAVHGAGLVHGDVKTQNVIRETGGRLVLMDFGAVQPRESIGLHAAVAGTPLYLAPELLEGAPPSPQSDIYALGVLLYRLATASYPIMAASLDELRRQHQSGARRHLRDVRPELPDGFVKAVETAIDPDPARRFATAGELESALRNGGAAAGAVGVARAGAVLSRRALLMGGAVALAALVGGTALLWRETTPPSATQQVRTLAVLPLDTIGDGDAYLGNGLTEAIQQELATAGPLRVVSRTSVDRLVAQKASLSDLARMLEADAIVEGTVFRRGSDVRVNIRVIHAGTDTAVWASTFQGASSNLLELERDIAQGIVADLRLALAPAAARRWQQVPAVDPDAYDEYLRGRYAFRQETLASTEAALACFRKSVALDPRFARAHIGMADAYRLLGDDFAVMPSAEAARLARESVARALELDPDLAEAHAALANLTFEFDWDFAVAEAGYRRAIELDPSLVGTREDYGMFLASRGRFNEAFGQLSVARQLDPLSPHVTDTTAELLYYARQYERALSELRRVLQLEPGWAPARVGLGRVFNALGRHEEAIAEYQRVATDRDPFFDAELAQAEAALGRAEAARRRIDRLRRQIDAPASQAGPHLLVWALAPLNRDEAFFWLNRAFDERSGRVLWLKVDPRADPLRGDPRFRNYLSRLGLEP
ncbi:MAG: protein kinase [Acidobacteria bacterium]|nr:protein kinase [Acidobacteriota bacterium]